MLLGKHYPDRWFSAHLNGKASLGLIVRCRYICTRDRRQLRGDRVRWRRGMGSHCWIDVLWSGCKRGCLRGISRLGTWHVSPRCIPWRTTLRGTSAPALINQDMWNTGGISMARTDHTIRDDVYAELAWDPKVTVADRDVRVHDGHVTLTGVAATFATKDAAADAAYRVYGVKDVDNDILVDPAAFGLRTDSQIEADVGGMLMLDSEVPDTRITVGVLDGVVTLSGDVDYFYQREAAEDDAASIAGVRDVISTIAVLQQPSAPDIADQIEAAFARNGELFDDNISVTADGHSVILSGTVRYWSEYDAAEDIAWRAPGVTNVTNNVVVTY